MLSWVEHEKSFITSGLDGLLTTHLLDAICNGFYSLYSFHKFERSVLWQGDEVGMTPERLTH